MEVAFAPPALVARWKRSVNEAPVDPVPVFAIVPLRVTALPVVADVGVMEPAVRSGWGGGAVVMTTLHHTGPPPVGEPVMKVLPASGPVSVPDPAFPLPIQPPEVQVGVELHEGPIPYSQ
jgi:hypothetical protein